MKTQRVVFLDLIRMAAILLVITQHAWSGLRLDEPVAGDVRYIYQELVVMGVPLFFMLSGALMLGGKPLPIAQFLSRRLKRLLVPYPLVGMLCMFDVWGWCPLWIRPLVIALLLILVSYIVTWIADRIRWAPNAWVGI